MAESETDSETAARQQGRRLVEPAAGGAPAISDPRATAERRAGDEATVGTGLSATEHSATELTGTDAELKRSGGVIASNPSARNASMFRLQVLGPTLLEAALVVLGVVLAFAANEWREHRWQKQQADTALSSFRSELSANREVVQSAFEYHRDLMTAMRQRGDSAEGLDLSLFQRGFVAPAQVMSTAWDAAMATNTLGHMDYERVLAASRIYARQDRYQDQARMAGQAIYQELLSRGTDTLRENPDRLASIVGTFYFRERQLLEAYDQALAELGSAASDAEPTPPAAPSAQAPNPKDP